MKPLAIAIRPMISSLFVLSTLLTSWGKQYTDCMKIGMQGAANRA